MGRGRRAAGPGVRSSSWNAGLVPMLRMRPERWPLSTEDLRSFPGTRSQQHKKFQLRSLPIFRSPGRGGGRGVERGEKIVRKKKEGAGLSDSENGGSKSE